MPCRKMALEMEIVKCNNGWLFIIIKANTYRALIMYQALFKVLYTLSTI